MDERFGLFTASTICGKDRLGSSGITLSWHCCAVWALQAGRFCGFKNPRSFVFFPFWQFFLWAICCGSITAVIRNATRHTREGTDVEVQVAREFASASRMPDAPVRTTDPEELEPNDPETDEVDDPPPGYAEPC